MQPDGATAEAATELFLHYPFPVLDQNIRHNTLLCGENNTKQVHT